MRANPALIPALIGVLATALGCGRAQDVSSPDTTATAPVPASANGEQTFVIESKKDSIDHHGVVVVALDFSNARKVSGAGDRQIDSVHSFVGNVTGCAPDREASFVAAMGSALTPKDTGYVGHVRVDLTSSTHAPRADSTMCFGVHTKSGWVWRLAQVPIVIDYGTSDFGAGPGGGHFDLDVRTEGVDLVALMMGKGGEALTKVTYTAMP